MIKDLITPGIGFTPASIKFILTRGLDIGAVTIVTPQVVLACNLRDNSALAVQLRDNSALACRLRDNSAIAVNLEGDAD